MLEVQGLQSLAVTLLGEIDEAAQVSRLGSGVRAHRFLDSPECSALTGSEADSRLARKPLHVDDPAQGDRVSPVLGLDRERALTAVAERLFELLGRADLDERAHDLTAVETDLDPEAFLSQR
jgi:hypothetical protein